MNNLGLSGALKPAAGAILTSPPALPAREDRAAQAAAASLEVEQVAPDVWEHFAAQHADVMQEQTHCFNAARWGPNRLERILIKQDGAVIGGAVTVLIDVPVVKRGIAIVKWGPLWRPFNSVFDSARLEKCLNALKREYAYDRNYFLTIMPAANSEFAGLTVSALERFDFKRGRAVPHPERYLVNVALDAEELRASLEQKWRYNLKKSLKNSLEINLTDSGDNLTEFSKLYKTMLARKAFHDTSAIDTLHSIMASEAPYLRPKVIMVNHDGRPTAGAVIDISGDTAVYLYGATDERALRLKAGYAMHWWIAEWLCAMPQIRAYDLGGSDGDQGLHQFKKGFVGKQGQIIDTPANYNFGASLSSELLGRSIHSLNQGKGTLLRHLHRLRSAVAG